jgi:hypothetical protein
VAGFCSLVIQQASFTFTASIITANHSRSLQNSILPVELHQISNPCVEAVLVDWTRESQPQQQQQQQQLKIRNINGSLDNVTYTGIMANLLSRATNLPDKEPQLADCKKRTFVYGLLHGAAFTDFFHYSSRVPRDESRRMAAGPRLGEDLRAAFFCLSAKHCSSWCFSWAFVLAYVWYEGASGQQQRCCILNVVILWRGGDIMQAFKSGKHLNLPNQTTRPISWQKTGNNWGLCHVLTRVVINFSLLKY